MLRNKNILLGVTGGIAAYKSAALVSLLKKKEANVKVIMTEHATKFVTPLTFQTMSENPVYVNMFEERNNMEVEHISLAKWADVIVVAPATANTIAKMNMGLGDNMLTTVLLAKRSPVLVAPAMNTAMMENIQNEKNLMELKEKGFLILPCDAGRLACGDVGSGKMLEPEKIVEYITMALTPQDLKGKKVIVTAGGTREPMDPVRFVANRSSGKMGYAVAREARNRGAETVLISAPTALAPPPGMKVVQVESTRQMLEAVLAEKEGADVLISPAAPADFRPASYAEHKIKKNSERVGLTLELAENPDILKTVAKDKGKLLMVGFAAESQNVEEHARKKLISKSLDFIVANNIVQEGAGFSGETNIAMIIDKNGAVQYDCMGKDELAVIIIDRIVTLLES